MADVCLPFEQGPRPLRWLFLDLNAYFASVEQQMRPELRHRPVAVAPVDAETTFCIAASYEAKAFGVKTGTMVADARRMCPGIEIVLARPAAYVQFHKRIVEVASTVLPLDRICSIDEMQFTLLGSEQTPIVAAEIGREMKRRIRAEVGAHLGCSVGIAPNHFLAKIATDMQKPDGLVILTADDLPHRLHPMALTELCGINRGMKGRLHGAGIFTVEQLCAASKDDLRNAFRSIIGERWWYLLRGCDIPPEDTTRKSLGHSHVLPPNLRTEAGSREVLLRLLQKGAARLRSEGFLASSLDVGVRGRERSWSDHCRFTATADTLQINDEFARMWPSRDFDFPQKVAITFSDLARPEETTPSLFDDRPDRTKLMSALDRLNVRYGRNAVHIAAMTDARHAAEEKIAFGKVDLFDEGPIAGIDLALLSQQMTDGLG